MKIEFNRYNLISEKKKKSRIETSEFSIDFFIYFVHSRKYRFRNSIYSISNFSLFFSRVHKGFLIIEELNEVQTRSLYLNKKKRKRKGRRKGIVCSQKNNYSRRLSLERLAKIPSRKLSLSSSVCVNTKFMRGMKLMLINYRRVQNNIEIKGMNIVFPLSFVVLPLIINFSTSTVYSFGEIGRNWLRTVQINIAS